jgi:hypothetical protein
LAFKQAKIYSAEPLAGFEVASPRYLVLVSEKRLEQPLPTLENGVTYQYRIIAVDPDTPAADARKKPASIGRVTSATLRIRCLRDPGGSLQRVQGGHKNGHNPESVVSEEIPETSTIQ